MRRSTVPHACGRPARATRIVSPTFMLALLLTVVTLSACGSPRADLPTDPTDPTGPTDPADASAVQGGPGTGSAVATFDDGSAVVFGRGEGTFGDLSTSGPLFVGKVDPAGTWAWLASAGTGFWTGAQNLPHAASALSDGGTLVAGQFEGTMPLGTLQLVNVSGRPDAFVAKVDADGTWVWATAAGGPDDVVARSVSATPDGSAYVAGWLDSDDVTFGEDVVGSSGSYDTFVAKIDATGAWEWVTTPGGDGKAEAVTALPDGGAIVVGWFTGSMTFGPHSVSANGVDGFVAKIEANGAWAWATKVTGSNNVHVWDASSTVDGGAVMVGSLRDTVSFGALTQSAPAGVTDAFVAKVAANGTWVWATAMGGVSSTVSETVRTLADGSAIVGGSFKQAASFGGAALTSSGVDDLDAFIAKVDSGGAWVWAVGGGGTANDIVYGVAAWSDGSAIGTGVFNGPATFGDTPLAGTTGSTVLVAKVDANGNW